MKMAGKVNLKYGLVNPKYMFPEVTYETYLVDILNVSHYFYSKRRLGERFKLIKEQAHSECDASSSLYQLDFKILVSEDVMNALSKNKPQVDCSYRKQGFIFSKSPEKEVPVPADNILNDIIECTNDDIEKETYKNRTIKNLIKNLKKEKNLFLYYPYEFPCNPGCLFLASELTAVFKTVLLYRKKICPSYDTFICIKVERSFLIYEWIKEKFIHCDTVDEVLCTNYKEFKKYLIY